MEKNETRGVGIVCFLLSVIAFALLTMVAWSVAPGLSLFVVWGAWMPPELAGPLVYVGGIMFCICFTGAATTVMVPLVQRVKVVVLGMLAAFCGMVGLVGMFFLFFPDHLTPPEWKEFLAEVVQLWWAPIMVCAVVGGLWGQVVGEVIHFFRKK